MAPNTKHYGHSSGSPSAVTESRRQIKPGNLLGNFGRLYKQFPALSLDDQQLATEWSLRQYLAADSTQKDTAIHDVSPTADHSTPLPHSVWDSPPVTPTHSTPKLGRLDKLEKLGIPYIGSYKPGHSQPHKISPSHSRGELKTHLQSPLQTSTYSARLQRAYGLSIHNVTGRDTSSTEVEPESSLDGDDVSANDLVSKATTPATSPDFTFELQAKIDAIVNKSTAPSTRQDIKVIVPPGSNHAHTLQGRVPQISQLPPGLFPSGPLSYLLHFQKEAQQCRSNISDLITTYSDVLQEEHTVTLPWDEQGNYTVTESPNHQMFGISYGNKAACIIEPHYRVDKATQLSIVKARLAQMEIKRQIERANSTTAQDETPVMVVQPSLIYKSTQPIHVFVDMSNIVIGFYDYIRQERKIPSHQRIQASFFFEALAAILERERPCVKRIVAGSMGPGAPWAAHMFEAQSSGYTMHILQRVKGPKPSKINLAQSSSPSMLSPQNGWNVHHEQGVDELLQLHMLQSIVDTPTPFTETGEALPPGTMVLATGDGAEAEFSDGFFNHVLRALKHGWCVEVVGFRHNMNQLWDEQAIPVVWRAQFRIIYLDDFGEELLASFR
ncbi:hypothetical protein N0V93_008353 [Gnomoniopsis smithogilvyi]|uniref:Uncharacterized protein n=1 Tax=Gnomoniopsis smithogilvyi TaxID=1191159 RepID=A0A9W9CUP1_9PEZI|nr:hypothetical protein N0V93_008353 [Gnomoniopsis smithogilvyi]